MTFKFSNLLIMSACGVCVEKPLMGVPHSWMGGVPHSWTGGTRDGVSPLQHRTAYGVLDMRRAVCLLRSRRRLSCCILNLNFPLSKQNHIRRFQCTSSVKLIRSKINSLVAKSVLAFTFVFVHGITFLQYTFFQMIDSHVMLVCCVSPCYQLFARIFSCQKRFS